MAEAIPILSKKLDGKVAIVTGAASGIGAFTARHFADHGARMVVIADVQDAKGQKVASSIGTQICTYVHCDVTDEDQVKSLVDSTVELYGQLDVMFSNAGISALTSAQTVLELDLSAYDRVMAVNARGTAACVKHAARAMVAKGVKGSIVCVGSYIVECRPESITDYSMSKHAVVGLVRAASAQLAASGVRVNCMSPGLVGTVSVMKATKMIGEEELNGLLDKVYTGAAGTMTEKHVADAVVFLASDDSAFVTGQNLMVEGGYGDKALSMVTGSSRENNLFAEMQG